MCYLIIARNKIEITRFQKELFNLPNLPNNNKHYFVVNIVEFRFDIKLDASDNDAKNNSIQKYITNRKISI